MKPVTATPPSERAYQAAVVELAHVLGWTVAHFRAARTERGWRTPVGALTAARGKVSVDDGTDSLQANAQVLL